MTDRNPEEVGTLEKKKLGSDTLNKNKDKALPVVDRERELQEHLQKAKESGISMIAIWRIEDGRIHLHRQMRNFPLAEIQGALDLLDKDVQGVNQQTGLGKKA